MKELNKQLKQILETITPHWDGQAYVDIIEIEKAIKSKYRDKKEYVINKFNK